MRKGAMTVEQYQNMTALKFLVRKLRYLLGYRNNRYYNKDAVDDIFERLYGVRLATKVIEAENDAEVCREIDMFGTTELIILFNNTETYKALVDLINLYNETRSIQDDIRRNSKNNRETSKRTKKRYDELRQYYEESVKDIRKYLGLEKMKSGISSKYRHLESIRGNKVGKKSPYRKNQNNLFGQYMDDEDDIDAYIDERWGENDELYHPYSKDDDDVDSRSFTPRTARSEGIFDGEFGALLSRGKYEMSKKKKENKINPQIDEYSLYKTLKNKYEDTEPDPKKIEKESKSESNDLTLKMMEMMMTMMRQPQPQASGYTDPNLSKLNEKLDDMNDFMNGIASDMIEVQNFMNDISNTRDKARNIAKSIKRQRQSSSNIGLSREELDDDDDDEEEYKTPLPKYMKLIQSGNKDFNVLKESVIKHYQNRAMKEAHGEKDYVYLEGEMKILLKWIHAYCSNNIQLQDKARAELLEYQESKYEYDSSEDDLDTPYLDMDVDDLIEVADNVNEQPRPRSSPLDPIEDYNNSHAQ